jgi:subtilase-type serine protease
MGVAAPPAVAQLSVPPAPIETYDGDPGRLGDPASWRTPEFLRDNGMLSISAEYAYAAGYAGQGENIGMVDSGTFAGHMREHGSKDTNYAVGDRYHSVEAQGIGDAESTTPLTGGFYNQAINDTHGTHVSGTIGASRDGVGETQPTGPVANMHGVAFNIDLYSGNTGKTDGVFYGLLPATATLAQTPDNGYIGNVYRAVKNAATLNGKPIRLITSSWGSAPNTENYNTLEPLPGQPASFGLNAAWRNLAHPEGVADGNGKIHHWLNGAIEVARSGVLFQITAGNAGVNNPTARAATPYYLPDLESTWYTTSGINPGTGRTFNADGSVLVPGTSSFNRCGVAKWSCVTAPGNNINSTTVQVVSGTPQPRYGSASGTSMSGPHSAAALALILQRFPYMTNTQALHTMFTTGRQNATISDAANPSTSIPNPTRGQMVQVPDVRNGWGTVNLRDAFKGPGQLYGPVDLDTKGYSDVWSNNVSDVAVRARQQEDAGEAAAWEATKIARGWTAGLPADATDKDKFDYDVGTRREAARNARVYVGSLTKRGDGTLFLTGENTWSGKSTVQGGKLSVVGSHASPIDVSGGTLGGSGTVGGAIDVASGVLAPGLSAAEAARITDVPATAGNVLNAAGGLRLAAPGRLSVVARSGSDYTRVESTGPVALGGALDLDLQGALTPGTQLTIVKGGSLTGTFADIAEGSFLYLGQNTLKASYQNNAFTLTVAETDDLPVGGTVPATLSLTLGAPASFGAFTPGVTGTYEASTTANVISTAGDALLSVADPSSQNTGHLVNGSFFLPQPLQARARNAANTSTAYNNVGSSASPLNLLQYEAPISNDAVALQFSQLVNANDALRTGSYSKTLTFTLSTTNP